MDADGKGTMPMTLEDEMAAEAKKRAKFKSPALGAKPVVDPNASTMTGPASMLAPTGPMPIQAAAATPPSAQAAPLNARDVLTNAAADRERVLSDIWRARYGSPENRNPAAVAGLIDQRKTLERGISEGRAAVAPPPVMPYEQARASRNSIIDLYERENMNRATAGQQPGVPQPTFVPRNDADYARMGDMQRMGVNDIDMRELERLSGRPSPTVAYTPQTEPQMTPPPRLTREAYDLEALGESTKREAAFNEANREGSIPRQAISRLASAADGEREMVALQRQVAKNQLGMQAVQTDPDIARQQMAAEREALAAANSRAKTESRFAQVESDEQLRRLETRDDQAEKLITQLTPSVRRLIGSAGVGVDDTEELSAMNTTLQLLMDRAAGWSPAKTDRYRRQIIQELGIGRPEDLDYFSPQNWLDRNVLQYDPLAGEKVRQGVLNSQVAKSHLAQLRSFLFPAQQ